ncbi:MAG TPA: RNA-binding protein [Verrucomicrobiae bacterium]|nr:RNA-binding protein [Verrucomicrobiae bacterium]
MPAYDRPPHGFPGDPGSRPPIAEDTLHTEKIQIERKAFVFALKENPRGRFLRITEDVGGRRDTIIIPATGLEEFAKVIEDMLRHSAERPPQARQP